jgi:hypothetical protein
LFINKIVIVYLTTPGKIIKTNNIYFQQDESSEDTQHFSLHADPPEPQKQTPDADELFCLSVAASLRRFSPQKKALAKLRIQQVMYDVEFLDEVPTNATSVRPCYSNDTIFMLNS